MKKTLVIVGAIILIGLISSFCYWYFNIFQKSVKTPEKTIKEYLKISLKPEFLPAEVDLKQGGINLLTGTSQNNPNLYGTSWNISDKDFYAELAYNKEGEDINYFGISIYYNERIDLDENIALDLTKKYFSVSDLNFECKEDEADISNKYCKTPTIIETNYKRDFSVLTFQSQDEKIKVTSINYFLRPLMGQRYGEENIWGF